MVNLYFKPKTLRNLVRWGSTRVAEAVMGIPAKLNTFPEGSRTAFQTESEHRRSEATLAF
jgi:hypothetical protein